MSHYRPFAAALLALATSGSAFAADPGAPATTPPDDRIAAGQRLVTQHCVACHQSEVYTRPDRRVHSMDGLHAQVGRCEQSLGLRWFEEEIENVASYLNREFYRFP